MDRTSANLIQMKMRSAERQDADDIAHLVNLAFRPERFFVDADRTDPNKVRALLRRAPIPAETGDRTDESCSIH